MNKNIIILILLVIFTITFVNCGNSEDNKATTTIDEKTTDATVTDVKVSDEKTIGILSPVAEDKEVVIAFAESILVFENRDQARRSSIGASGTEETEKKYRTELEKVVEFCLDENNELSKSEECQIIIKKYTQR